MHRYFPELFAPPVSETYDLSWNGIARADATFGIITDSGAGDIEWYDHKGPELDPFEIEDKVRRA